MSDEGRVMSADEAIATARRMIEEDSGDPWELIESGLDVMGALVAEVERLRAEVAAVRVSYEERGTALVSAVRRAANAQRLLDAVEGTEREEELARQIRAEAQAQVATARVEGAEAVRDAAMSVADDLVGGLPEASDCEWAHELMERCAVAVAKIRAKGGE